MPDIPSLLNLPESCSKVLLADHSDQKKQGTEPIPASEANVPDIPDAVYELLTGYGLPARILMTLWGLALCVNFLPSVVLPLAASFHNLFSPDTLPIAPTAPPYLLGVALLLYGVVGIFLLVLGIRGVNVSIRIDAAGLCRGRRGTAYVLLIANVGAVVARVRKGALISYQVLDANQQPRIVWPARPGRVLTKRTLRSAQAVSPDQMAALVAKRSGKTIEQRGVGER